MGTIEEVIEDVTEVVKDNKGVVIGGIAVIVLIVLLTKNNSGNTDSEEYQLATSYSSYPDAVTNANNIIDSLQGSIDASDLDMKEFMSDNFSVAKDYMSEGLEKVVETNNKLQDTTIQSTDTIRNDIKSVNTKVDNVQNYLTTTVTPKVDSVQKTVNTVNNTVNSTAKTVKKVESNTNKIKKAVSTAKPKATAKTTPKTSSKTIKKTNYKGSSIVDGLKSVGVNSSYANRKKLAQANGIKNYTGTASQNTALLNKLKKGTLKKAK